MLKKFFMVVIAVFLLLSPIVGSTMEITMPYFKIIGGKKVIRNIPIQLPLEITEDFTKWPALIGAYQGKLEVLPDMLGVDTVVGQFVFTNKEINISYTLYVYSKAPLVLGLQRTEQLSPYNPPIMFKSFWKYVDKKPVKVTEKQLGVFLISATYAKEM